MWISKQMQRPEESPTVQAGRVAVNSDNSVEAVSTSLERNIKLYSPFGYRYCLPSGAEILLAGSDAAQAGVGVEMNSHGLKQGEIYISNLAGAYIYLRKDGNVIINGLEIDCNGEVIGNGK